MQTRSSRHEKMNYRRQFQESRENRSTARLLLVLVPASTRCTMY